MLKTIRLAAALLFLSSLRASAQPFAANFAAAGLVPLTFPLAPLAEGRWDVSVSPAYFRLKTFNSNGGDDFKDMSGFGGAGSAVYGLSDHFGLGLTALGFSGSGNYDLGSIPPLPSLFGLHYESMHDTIDYGGASGTEQQDLDSLGIQGGLSVLFETGPVRWQPFAMTYFPFGHEKQIMNGSTSPYVIHSDAGLQPGINVTFLPWNLAFFTTLGEGKAKGTHVYSLRWKTSIGE